MKTKYAEALAADPIGPPHPDEFAHYQSQAKDLPLAARREAFEESLPDPVRHNPVLARRLSWEVCTFADRGERTVSNREWKAIFKHATALEKAVKVLPVSVTRTLFEIRTIADIGWSPVPGFKPFVNILRKVGALAQQEARGNGTRRSTPRHAKELIEDRVAFLLAAYNIRLTTYPEGHLANVLRSTYLALGHKRQAATPDTSRTQKRLVKKWTTREIQVEIRRYAEANSLAHAWAVAFHV